MSKRKILLLAMTIIMVAILAVGGTLAYFTSEGSADNVFTMGNVEIELDEIFDEDEADLEPGVEIEKQVWVENTGSNDAYVRVHIAIPTDLDAQDPTKSNQTVMEYLHFLYGGDTNWNWNKGDEEGNPTSDPYFYVTNIKDEETEEVTEYNVYVVTYQKALKADEATGNAIEGVVLDVDVDATTNREDDQVVSYTYIDEHGHEVTLPIDLVEEELVNISIKVYAEGTQTGTFDHAYEALDTAFGVAGEDYDPWNGAYDAE